MLLCTLQGAAVFVSAADEDQPAEVTEADAAIVNDGSAELVFADESILQYTQSIYFPYLETGAVLNSWSFPYSDRFFEIPSSQFSVKMAQGSLGLAVSAFRSTRFEEQYETYLHQAGFYNLYPFGYDKKTEEDSISGIIGMKEVGGRTVIAAVTCGQGYKTEWAGNMKIGKGVRHQGFETGAKKLEAHIDEFIKQNGIEGDKVLWITGMSRAAAIANLTAADAIESGEYDDVYAYLFGVPRVTKKPVKYPGIYNICGQYDAVPAIPMQSWGFERYGIDLYTPSQEADDGYPTYALAANEVGNNLDGKGFRNNPEINYQLRLIIEFMSELFDGSDDYADRFQDIMVKAVVNNDEGQVTEILSEAFSALSPRNKKEERRTETVVDYISFVVAQHMRANQRQVDDGSWDPTESLNSNLMLEHRPSTYVKWVFSDLPPETIFTAPIESRRVTIDGRVDVTVYAGEFALTAVNRHGKVYSPDPDLPEEVTGEHSIFVMRNGDETIVSLPNNSDYSVEISSDQTADISYLDVLVTPEDLVTENVTIHVGRITNRGILRLNSVPGVPLGEPEIIAGSYNPISETEYTYSPTVIMQKELKATRGSFLSLGRIIDLLRGIAAGLVLMTLIVGVINNIQRRKVKRGEREAVSDLNIIIPLIICIVTSAIITQFASFYLFTLPAARTQCATLTMIFITVLALRGTLKSKNPMAFLITVLMGVLTYCTYQYYRKTFIDSFSLVNMTAYFVLIAALTAMACWTFKRPKTGALGGTKAPAEAWREDGGEPEEGPGKAGKK